MDSGIFIIIERQLAKVHVYRLKYFRSFLEHYFNHILKQKHKDNLKYSKSKTQSFQCYFFEETIFVLFEL